MAVQFSGVAIFYCEGRNCGFYGELMVGKCVPGNCSGIGRGSGCGCVLGWLCGLQGGEVRQVNDW